MVLRAATAGSGGAEPPHRVADAITPVRAIARTGMLWVQCTPLIVERQCRGVCAVAHIGPRAPRRLLGRGFGGLGFATGPVLSHAFADSGLACGREAFSLLPPARRDTS